MFLKYASNIFPVWIWCDLGSEITSNEPASALSFANFLLFVLWQLRIQDFPFGGGADPLGRAPTSSWMCMLFIKNICENERIGSCWGHVPAAPPGSTNVWDPHHRRLSKTTFAHARGHPVNLMRWRWQDCQYLFDEVRAHGGKTVPSYSRSTCGKTKYSFRTSDLYQD